MAAAAVIALLPTLPPESNQIRIPGDMPPEDRELFLRELGSISRAIAAHEAKTTEQIRSIFVRLERLEHAQENTGEHRIVELRQALAERRAEQVKFRYWILSGVAVVLTGLIVGLLVHFL